MKKIKMNKKGWMQIHTYLSLFFLPVAIIYVLTGALYMFGINHHTTATTSEFKLESPVVKGKETQTIISTLKANNIKLPSDTSLKIQRGNATIGNVAYSATLTKDKQNNAIVRVTDRSLYSILMMMHKSTGSKSDIFSFKLHWFDALAILFSISMLLFYLSGLIVTSFCKKNRKNAIAWFMAGLFATIFAIYFSL